MALFRVGQARNAMKDEAGARAVFERNLALVDELIARAPSAAAAASLEDWRASILVQLKRPDEAVAIFERRERAAPDDLNASANLADTLQQAKRYEDALAAVDRALAKAYGPFKSSLYTQKREILEALKRPDEARKVVEEQLAYYRTLPDGQQRPETVAKLEQRLAAMAKR